MNMRVFLTDFFYNIRNPSHSFGAAPFRPYRGRLRLSNTAVFLIAVTYAVPDLFEAVGHGENAHTDDAVSQGHH